MKRMCRFFAILTGLLLAAPVVLAESDAEWRARVDAELKALRKENQDIKRENKELKKRVEKQEEAQRAVAAGKSVDRAYDRAMGGGVASTAFVASGLPDIKGTGLYFTGEFIYWKPQQDHLNYVVRDDPRYLLAAWPASPRGDAVAIEHDWAPGFRLGVGYRLPWDGWDFQSVYTYYRSEETNRESDLVNRNLIAILADIGMGARARDAIAHLDLSYDVLDVELGRSFKLSKSVTVRPFGGLRMTWLENDSRVNYFGRNFPGIRRSRLGGEVDDKSDFFGYGIRLGAEGNLNLKYGFSFFGKADASLLTGEFELEHFEAEDDGVGLGTPRNSIFEDAEVRTLIREELHRVVPVVQLAAGVAWEKKLLDNLNFQASLGYEFVNYYNVVQRRAQVDDVQPERITTSTDDLGFHGFFFRIRLDF
jgi:hypothetical protein